MTTKLARSGFSAVGILSGIAIVPLFLGGMPPGAAGATPTTSHSSMMSPKTKSTTMSPKTRSTGTMSHQSSSTHPVLMVGSGGPAVKKVQTSLKRDGYYRGSVDGVYGRGTKMAVMQLQKAKGLKQDGVVGSRTWKAVT